VSAAKKRPRKKREPKPKAATPAPEDTRSAAGLLKWTLLVLGVFLLTTAIVAFGIYPTSPGPGPGNAVEIDVVDTNAGRLADQLASAHVLTSARYFAWYVRLTGGTGAIVTGRHYVTDDLSPRELLRRLERRSTAHARIVIPEGWTRFDIARRLDALHVCTLRAFLQATEDPNLLASLKVPFDPSAPSAEGFLFPATYEVALDADPASVVQKLVHQFDKRYAALEARHERGIQDLEDSLGWKKRQIVILASMIEKEAAVDDERPIIASVFLNRLRDPSFHPKRLQCDPTAGYGCLVGTAPSCTDYVGKVTHAINEDPANAYSTYVHDGLPPGPIASPGAKSLEAVMSPSLTHYFYFVAKGGGRHTFSETLGAHNAAVHGDGGI
jgi:UPF0755 protein